MDLLNFFKEYYDVFDDQVAFAIDQITEDTFIYYGDLDCAEDSFVFAPNLRVIIGNANCNSLITAVGMGNLEFVIGNAYFHNLKSAIGLERLRVISGDAFFDLLTKTKPLSNLDSIGGIGYFGSVRNKKYLMDTDIGQGYFPKVRKK